MSSSTPVLVEDASTPSMVMTLEAASLRLAVPLANTLEVRQAERLVKPCALAPYQLGMLVLRGQVLPVFNLSAFVKAEAGEALEPVAAEPAMHMVVSAEGRTLVLGVDAVLGVEEVALGQLQAPVQPSGWVVRLITHPDTKEVVQLVDVTALADIAGLIKKGA